MEDAELRRAVEGALGGDQDAFADLYHAFAPRVWGLCRRMLGSAEAADDATSDIFVKLQNVLDRYDPNRPFATWLLGITGNYCIDLLRRRKRERRIFDTELLESPWQPEAQGPAPLGVALQEERKGAVRAAIEELPENYRVPLTLRYYGGLTYDEIAETTGLTRNNVATLLFRAKKKLRVALEEEELFQGPEETDR